MLADRASDALVDPRRAFVNPNEKTLSHTLISMMPFSSRTKNHHSIALFSVIIQFQVGGVNGVRYRVDCIG